MCPTLKARDVLAWRSAVESERKEPFNWCVSMTFHGVKDNQNSANLRYNINECTTSIRKPTSIIKVKVHKRHVQHQQNTFFYKLLYRSCRAERSKGGSCHCIQTRDFSNRPSNNSKATATDDVSNPNEWPLWQPTRPTTL